MVRNYKPRFSTKQPKTYTEETLQEACSRVADGERLRRVAAQLQIPHRTLRNRCSGNRLSNHTGRQTALLPEEELSIAQHMATFSDFGYPFDSLEIRIFVKSFLDKAGRTCSFFKNNAPGYEWVKSFLKRHDTLLSNRLCQNINRQRAAVSEETANKYFDNLEVSLAGVPPENIINYDETNLSDDPKAKLMVFRKGIKHPERVMNSSKSSVSLMFACAANGTFLPPYVVYKAERMMDTWVLGGPCNARYNRSKSGWFDSYCFTDWVEKLAVPYFRHLQNDAPRVLIGDNLACHISATLVEICERDNIKMIFLPPNSTQLMQPLDVAVYGPMKEAWRKVLTEWKNGIGRYNTTLPKPNFPNMLFILLTNMDRKEEFAVNGFRTTGIYPVNRKVVITKITKADVPQSSQHLVSPLLIEHLKKLREQAASKPGAVRRGRAIQVEPGKSVSLDNVASGTSCTTQQGSSNQQSKRNPKRRLPVESSDESDTDMSVDVTPDLTSDDESPNLASLPDVACQAHDETLDTSILEQVDFIPGDFVVVKFSGKTAKTMYHYVGKILKIGEESLNIQYFRRCYDLPSGVSTNVEYISVKEPNNPDIMETQLDDIAKKLPKPLITKDRFSFPKNEFHAMILR